MTLRNLLLPRVVAAIGSLAAIVASAPGVHADFVREAWLRTYDAQGTQFTNGRGDEIADMAVDAAGDVIVTGKSAVPDGQDHDYDYYTAKYSGTDGHLIWEQRYDGNDNFDEPRALALDAQGNVVVTGYSILPRSGKEGESYDWYTVKYDGSDGRVIWSRVVSAPAQERDEAYDVAIDAAGNAIVTGYISAQFDLPNTSTTSLAYTIKYAAETGATLWEQTYRNDTHQPFSSKVVIDPSGNALLIIELSGFDLHLAVAKYAAATGAVVWAHEEEGGEAGRYVQAYDLAVDGAGDLFITGRSLQDNDPFSETSDLYTARLSGSTGTRIWEKRTDSPTSGRDSSAAIAIDPAGNVITAGTMEALSFDIHTTKYAAADGAVIWNNVYNSPGTRPDRASHIVIDGDGNAYVTGSSDANSNVLSGELRTLKIRGTDGQLAWSRLRTTSSSSRTEYPANIGLTPDGGVVVAGSTVVNGRYDYLTIKYVPAGQPLNISTRVRVEAGEKALIGGFIVGGEVPKRVLIRAIGPSLTLPGKLPDPVLELNTSDGEVVTNDNWQSDQEAEIRATTIPPESELESAIIATLQPGGHTAVVRGNGAAAGQALVEVYDLDASSAATLANIATRGQVLSGDEVMIGGFIISPGQPSRVLVRGIGPSLTDRGVEGALADPTLELVDQNGTSTFNDDWRSTQEAEITATDAAPTSDKEAAIVATLASGPYTAIIRGAGTDTGVALIEVFNLP